jgi:hypothetical protein
MDSQSAAVCFARSLAVGLLALTVVQAARADTVTLTPSRDNTIFAEGQTSNGAGIYLFVGNNGQGNARRALAAFDLAASIPAGSTVQSVTLTMHMSKTTAGAEPVTLHRLLADWGEGTSDAAGQEGIGAPATAGDATWTDAFFGVTPWASPGGDFVASPSATVSVGAVGPYTWDSTAEMVADVQSWLDAAGTNFGWILLGNESGTPTAKRLGSRESSVEADRPTLTIEFLPPATVTSTPTSTPTPTSTTIPTATPTFHVASCPGDCDGNGKVVVNELVTAVNIALGNSNVSTCENADRNHSGTVTIDELIAAVNASLTGCP